MSVYVVGPAGGVRWCQSVQVNPRNWVDDLIHIFVQKYYALALTLDIEIVRVWRRKFSLSTVLCTLMSYLCVGLNIAPLTERSRNRTAGRNYIGVYRERLEMLNPGQC